MKTAVAGAMMVILGVAAFQFLPDGTISYAVPVPIEAAVGAATSTEPVEVKPRIVHIETPPAVKSVYITACIAATPHLRNKLVGVIEDTDVNSVIVDIKDYTGTLAYVGTKVVGPVGKGCRISDLQEFIAELHSKNLYTIARVTVFQDPLYATAHPELSVQSRARPGKPWVDRKGLAFIDPTFPAYWDYIIEISREAYAIGFDEINFDYIRFPSDGDMQDAMFAMSASTTRRMAMVDFFTYLRGALEPEGIVMSADVFGQTTVNIDDLGIGQVLEDILPYFDYVAPMVYPSHFIPSFNGFDNPAAHPYEVINFTMMRAVERTAAASSSPEKIRPWLQAFDMGATYTPEMIRKQIQATYDAGLMSWMLWDPANTYDRAALVGDSIVPIAEQPL